MRGISVCQQIERMASLLRDVQRSGGTDRWDHLKSHGHSHSTVRSAVLRGYLLELLDSYKATDAAGDFMIFYREWKKNELPR